MKCKLSYVSEIISGATPSTTHDEYYDGDVVWFTPKDLSDQNTKYVERGSRNITAEGFRSCSARMIPPYNLLMSSRAPIGLLSINEVECCTNQGFKSMVVDKTKADVDYLYYYIKHHLPEVEALGSGTTFKEVSRASLEKWEIDIPDLHTQKEISSILSFLDRKISLNRKANEVLEKMAKQLYDYWFVQFDFPDENGNPYKSSGGKMVYNETLKREIPEGWEVGELIDIANITMGQSPDGSSYNENGEGIIFYQGSTDFGIRFPNVRQYTTAPTRYASKGDILMSVRAPVGAMNFANNDCCIGRGLCAMNSKIGSITHLYYTVCVFKEKFEQASQVGTTFGSITKEELHSLPVVIPQNDVIGKFENICKPIFEQQMVLGNESLRLTSLRDFLLPMLMNGQVTIKD